MAIPGWETIRDWFRPGGPNEIIAHEWSSLDILWQEARKEIQDDEIRKSVDTLFPKRVVFSSGFEDWYDLNRATQMVGRYLTAKQLDTETAILLAVAEQRKLPNLETHRRTVEKSSQDEEARRVAYLALLDDLQRDFINTRYKRRLRREVARRLLNFGLTILALGLLPFAIMAYVTYRDFPSLSGEAVQAAVDGLYSSNPAFGLFLVAALGLLGAYFSRVTQFQRDGATIGFEEVVNTYRSEVLSVRLLVGTVGAVVFYFLMRSGIVGGDIFPNFDRMSLSMVPVLKDGAVTGKLDPSGLTILLPTKEFAKLLVWSFLAGFSERLVPDNLGKAVARATEGKPST